MQVLLHLRGSEDPGDLWPYEGHFLATGSGGVLSVRVSDTRDLVGLLLMLTRTGVDVVEVERLDGA